jgi:integrase
MGVKIRKKAGKWYLYINYHGRRKAKCIGNSREAAEQVKRVLEAKLALGDLSVLQDAQDQSLTFGQYARRWLKEYAELNCKPSTVAKHEEVLRLHLYPRFDERRVTEITRDDLKRFLAVVASKPKQYRKKLAEGETAPVQPPLARNSVRLIVATLRIILGHALEDGLIVANPAARLGRFTGSAGEKFRPSPLTSDEAERFLEAARMVCPEYYPLFLTALRTGLRRGELVALCWGDVQFGADENDQNRYILVQRNYVRGAFTTPKSKKHRRVDLSKQLRAELLRLRDTRLVEAFAAGQASIMGDQVFPAPEGGVLNPDNLYHRYFLPCLEHAGLRHIRLHDLRHTFGSLLIQDGASLAYVKEQMGHSSIQITADVYGHLIPGANVSWVDRLDSETSQKQNATPAQPRQRDEAEIPAELVDLVGGGGRTRTSDLRIMRPSL